jgi:hypothetical protein
MPLAGFMVTQGRLILLGVIIARQLWRSSSSSNRYRRFSSLKPARPQSSRETQTCVARLSRASSACTSSIAPYLSLMTPYLISRKSASLTSPIPGA